MSSPPSQDVATLEQLEKQLADLMSVKVFDSDVHAGVQHLLDTLPPPEAEKNTDRKVRLLLLRCKARLLMPYASKEAEKDLNMALKLKQGSADTWVELSECLLRRNAFKEACDALDNALRVDPKNTAALCKYSQVQRNRCGEAGLTREQKEGFLKESIAKARDAVQADMDSADAWSTLSLSLLSVATAEGMTYAGATKALAAMRQAARKVTDDPDVYFNKAVLEGLTGEFGASANDFARAHELDSTRLKGTAQLCRGHAAVVQRAAARMKNVTGIGRQDFKRTQSHLTAALAKAKESPPPACHYTYVAVVDILTETAMQPQALLVVNELGAFSFVLTYGVSGSSFKIGDVISFPLAKTQQLDVVHRLSAAPQMDVAELTLPMKHYYVSADSLFVNGHALSSQSRVPLQLSSRLFA